MVTVMITMIKMGGCLLRLGRDYGKTTSPSPSSEVGALPPTPPHPLQGLRGSSFTVSSLASPLGAMSKEHDRPEETELQPGLGEGLVLWRKGSVPGHQTDCLQRNGQEVQGELDPKREPFGRAPWKSRWWETLPPCPWQVVGGP